MVNNKDESKIDDALGRCYYTGDKDFQSHCYL